MGTTLAPDINEVSTLITLRTAKFGVGLKLDKIRPHEGIEMFARFAVPEEGIVAETQIAEHDFLRALEETAKSRRGLRSTAVLELFEKFGSEAQGEWRLRAKSDGGEFRLRLKTFTPPQRVTCHFGREYYRLVLKGPANSLARTLGEYAGIPIWIAGDDVSTLQDAIGYALAQPGVFGSEREIDADALARYERNRQGHG